MEPKLLKSTAQIIQPGFACTRANYAILGTLPVAGKQEFAVTALPRQGMELVESELALLISLKLVWQQG